MRISKLFQGKETSDCDPPSSIITTLPVDALKVPTLAPQGLRRRERKLCQWLRDSHRFSIPPMANARTWLCSKHRTSSLSVSSLTIWITRLWVRSSHSTMMSRGQTFMDMMMTIMRLFRTLQAQEIVLTRWLPMNWTKEHRCYRRVCQSHLRCSSSEHRGTLIWQITG